MRRRLLVSAMAAAVGLPLHAVAEAWPAHPLKFLVAWPPGGLNDVLARAYNDAVSNAIGQPIVLLNRPGFGGVVGTTEAARATPDGHTLAMGTLGPLTIAPHLRSDLQYTTKSFEPIAMLALSPMVLVVSPEVRASSLVEFFSLARTNPSALNFAGMGGIGTTQHLGFELVKQAAGIDITTVPFKGTSDALPALLTNQVQVTLDTLGPLLPHIKSGKLRALAVSSPSRVAQLPEVPTLAELGYGNAASFTWHVVLAPAGTPAPVLDRLHREYTAASGLPEIQNLLRDQSMLYQALSRPELVARIESESSTRRRIIAERGIKLQ